MAAFLPAFAPAVHRPNAHAPPPAHCRGRATSGQPAGIARRPACRNVGRCPGRAALFASRSMPEGHTIHRLARVFETRFRGRVVAASSPQGRFAAGAAALDGLRLASAEARGKHLFLRFEGGARPEAAPPVWLRVHLGLYGGWRFAGPGLAGEGGRKPAATASAAAGAAAGAAPARAVGPQADPGEAEDADPGEDTGEDTDGLRWCARPEAP